MTFVIDIFLKFFFLLDSVVYGLINMIYDIILAVSNIAVISHASMQTFAERIYVLVGVIMLFKVAFSLIQLFADPDKLTDSKSGVGNIVKRIMISLVLLVVTPMLFQLAFRVQGIILEEHLLEKVILNAGQGATDEEIEEKKENGGVTISFAIFRGFVQPNEKSSTYEDNLDDYNKAVKDQDMSQLGELITKGDMGDRPFEYSFIVSTIAGGFAAWMLFMFCFDVAIRAAKITFLQLLAPIPIISYVDVKKGKAIFDNWVKQCLSTYFDVFVKLITLFFVVYIISEISKDGLFSFYKYDTTGQTVPADDLGLLGTAFVVLGLLMFAKDAPKWISEMLGIKGSGDFSMNPFKKLTSSPLAAAAVGGIAGGVGGLAANSLALAKKMKKDGFKNTLMGEDKVDENGNKIKTSKTERARNLMRSAGSPLSGLFSGGFHGTKAGLTGGGKGNMRSTLTAGKNVSNQNRYNREVNRKAGYGFAERRIKDPINKAAGIKNKDAGVGLYDAEMKKYQKEMDNYSQQEQAVRNALAERMATDNGFSAADYDLDNFYQTDAEGNKSAMDWNDYISGDNPGKLSETEFNAVRGMADSIAHLDAKHEEARVAFKRAEDVHKAKNPDGK